MGESLGFGFVSFNSIESAIRAKHECKNKLFNGRYLIVNQFEPMSVRVAHILEVREKLKLEKHKMLMAPSVEPRTNTQPDQKQQLVTLVQLL